MKNFEEVPVWVLGNYRCGSIFLCKFLEKLRPKKPPVFYEHFNGLNHQTIKRKYGTDFTKWITADAVTRRELFFKHVIEKEKLPPKMKIMRDQFLRVCGLKDTDINTIEEVLPGIRYIYLKRDDLFSCAVSHYFAKKTKRWVLRPGDKKQYLKKSIPFNEKEIIKCYEHMKKYVEDDGWDKYLEGKDHLFLNFKEMVKNPVETFERVIEYLDIKFDGNIEKLVKAFEYVPTKRPESKEYIERLRKLKK